jgi:hypothetical protein
MDSVFWPAYADWAASNPILIQRPVVDYLETVFVMGEEAARRRRRIDKKRLNNSVRFFDQFMRMVELEENTHNTHNT